MIHKTDVETQYLQLLTYGTVKGFLAGEDGKPLDLIPKGIVGPFLSVAEL
jgi:hypothetical protein